MFIHKFDSVDLHVYFMSLYQLKRSADTFLILAPVCCKGGIAVLGISDRPGNKAD